MHDRGGTVQYRLDTLLRLRVCVAALILAFCTAPGSFSFQSTDVAIIGVKSKANAVDVSNRLGLTLLDSVSELNKYLVRGDAAVISNLKKDPDVLSVERNVPAEISETAILNVSTAALLDPNTVGLLAGSEEVWDGEHPVRSSLLAQPALQKIDFELPVAQNKGTIVVAVIDTGVDPLHRMLKGSTCRDETSSTKVKVLTRCWTWTRRRRRCCNWPAVKPVSTRTS